VRDLYCGPEASTAGDLAPYTGKDAEDALVGEARQRAFRCNYVQLFVNYGHNVEFQLRQELVLLCPQTAGLLYDGFTPLTARYQPGSRPRLEAAVAAATRGCATESDRALALMRYCRDLYRDQWYESLDGYPYGGTEEQLIDKGEILCECLGRLHVALCEVAGLPGRLVMHVVGGHICSEIYVDGGWAYMDPRCGVYFLRAGGALASVRDLCREPGLVRAQSDEVKADVSPHFTWEERAWKCENLFFDSREINGFQNYSLADADRYGYAQKPYEQAVEDGLFVINKDYAEATCDAFGLEGDGFRHRWGTRPLRRLPIAYRHDGFSMYFYPEPPVTRQWLEERYVDPFAGTDVPTLVWGLGPGSVFCYGTRAGQVFGDGLTPDQLALLREGDRRVIENVNGLIAAGDEPLRAAANRAHQLGLRLLARLEMNHEYGPPEPDNWDWVAFVGSFNKEHPQYRIPGTVLLDFKHPEVRDCKLAIFREALEAGVDGIAADFAVYPPFFEDGPAGAPIMTGFVRQVRALLGEFGEKQGRHLELMARVPAWDAAPLGLDWPTWMQEGLVDTIVPTHRHANQKFDIEIGEFVSMGHRTGVKVVPCLWQALGFVDTDERPEDDDTGARRYDKPKTQGMFFAQALLFNRAGADGLQLGFAADEWHQRPGLDELADPDKLRYADKHYMVDPHPHCPVRFEGSGERIVPLRIGDDIGELKAAGYGVDATVVLYATPLREGDDLAIYVNGLGPARPPVAPVPVEDVCRSSAGPPVDAGQADITEQEWWRRGECRVPVPADWWRLGPNEIRLVYEPALDEEDREFAVTWIDLLLDLDPPAGRP